MTGVYRDTLDLIRTSGEELNGAQWADKAGCNATAMNNRLVRLRELGFVTSRSYGRQKLFKASSTG